MIRVTEDNLEELSKRVEVLEVLDEGVKILTTKNGVVMRESVAKWDDMVVVRETGIIEIVGNIVEQAKKAEQISVELTRVQPMPEDLAEVFDVSAEKVTKKAKKAPKTKKA